VKVVVPSADAITEADALLERVQRGAPALSLTVGVPAFNEEANIGSLISQVLQQQEVGFQLERVVVASDASTDGTCAAVERAGVHDPRVVLLAGTERLGRSARQLQFMQRCSSDVLVSFDGDVSLPDPYVLARLIAPIAAGADLVAGGLIAAAPNSFFERSLASGLELRNRVSAAYRNGDNVYTCHGPVRAFSRRAYQTYPCGDGSAEDAYSYLWAKEHRLSYVFAEDAEVEIRVPTTLRDQRLQSARFQLNRWELNHYFPEETVRAAFRLPPLLCLKGLAEEVRLDPLHTAAYLAILGLTIMTTPKSGTRSNTWEIAASTKRPQARP
jgi:glycosyltransferase involved in cell wall biosynthesis